MTLVVVLDVNTFASAAATSTGLPGLVVDQVERGAFHLAISDHILRKLGEVLQRPYFAKRIGSDKRRQYLAAIGLNSVTVQPDPTVRGVADDEEDDIVLGTAVAAGADYLVTGDHGLLDVGSYGGVTIVTARQFLLILETE